MRHQTRGSGLIAIAIALQLIACAGLQSLTPAGRLDLVVEAAAIAIEEGAVQSDRIVELRRRDLLTQDQALARYRGIAQASKIAQVAIDDARAIQAAGGDLDGATNQARIAVDALRGALHRYSEDLP